MLMKHLVGLLSHTYQYDQTKKIFWQYDKRHFKKGLIMTKNNGDFKNSTKCWICDNVDDD